MPYCCLLTSHVSIAGTNQKKMHELFYQVLNRRDLSKAGDLFSLEDCDIANDLSEVLDKIQEIASAPNYLSNDNNQSVVEICITRVTSAVRYVMKTFILQTRTIEWFCVRRGGGSLCGEVQYIQGNGHIGPPFPWQNDRHNWKHCLPTTLLAGSNKLRKLLLM